MTEAESGEVRQRLATLPVGERIKRYREMSAEAFECAASARDANVRAERISIAMAWQVLATEVERMAEAAGTIDHALIGNSSTNPPAKT